MNLVDILHPTSADINSAPVVEDEQPFYVNLYGRTYEDTPCYQIRMNSNVSCLQYVLSGGGIIISDKAVYKVETGDTFILLEGKDQIYYSNPDNKFARLWFNFKGELSKALLSAYKLTDITVFKNTDSKAIIQKMLDTCRANTDGESYKTETAKMFLEIVQFLAKHKDKSEPIDNEVDKIRYYIDMHIMENIKLDDVATHFGFSKEHIIRTFKSRYGITPHKYIIQSKIRVAMIMLINSDLSIEEIASKLSFSDAHHFSSQFFSLVKTRPSAYRKQHKV